MEERVGEVLYWIACGIAGLFAILGVYLFLTGRDGYAWGSLLLCVIYAGVVWLVGRVILFALAGR